MTSVLAAALLLGAPCLAATPARVIVLGLDGLDWKVLRPLAEKGRLPHLSRLLAEGAWGTVHSSEPLKSPSLWTTAATGVAPEEHGVFDFFSGRRRVGSRDRRAHAIWETAAAAGADTLVVGWMATWPAESAQGLTVISDQALNPEVREGRVSPPDALAGMPVWAAWDPYGSEAARALRRFLGFEYFRDWRTRFPEGSPEYRRHRIVARRLARVFTRDESHVRIVERLLRRRRPRLVLVHLWGADQVSHSFWRHAFGEASEDERRDFGGTVAAYYEYIDELVGRLRRAAGNDALVLALSDHGFQAWTPPANFSDRFMSGGHAPDGVLLLAGPGVSRGARVEATLLDVAPTVLRALRLPGLPGRRGRVLEEAFAPGALPPPQPDAALPPRPGGGASEELSPLELDQLRAVGYLRPLTTESRPPVQRPAAP